MTNMDIFIQKNKYYEEGGNKPYFKIKKRDGDTFVEIGAWKGCSTAFLAVEAARSGKTIDIHVVDTFAGSDEEEHHKDPDLPNLRAVFDRDMEPAKDLLTVHQMPSVEAAVSAVAAESQKSWAP